MTKVLMILTGATVWTMKDGTPHPTGFWGEEFIKPHRAFVAAGFDVSISTPGGVHPTVDPLSLSEAYYSAEDIADQKAYLAARDGELSATLPLETVSAADWDIVFQVGGHGPMQDLAVHPTVGKLFVDVLADESKILAGVCHGPAAFLSAADASGKWAFAGRRLTAFTNEEETAATFAGNAPWLLEDRLRLAGARYESLPAWNVHIVEDGNLLTGQQQATSEALANRIVERVRSAA